MEFIVEKDEPKFEKDEPKLIPGGVACDDRGSLSFVNGFDFKGVKRFYQVENISKDVVRAFHGHLKEGKYVYVPRGCAKIVAIKLMGLSGNLSLGNEVNTPQFVLSSKKPSILWIPPGFANGFQCLEEGTILQFFSTSTLEESKGDDIRFDWTAKGKDIWKTKNR